MVGPFTDSAGKFSCNGAEHIGPQAIFYLSALILKFSVHIAGKGVSLQSTGNGHTLIDEQVGESRHILRAQRYEPQIEVQVGLGPSAFKHEAGQIAAFLLPISGIAQIVPHGGPRCCKLLLHLVIIGSGQWQVGGQHVSIHIKKVGHCPVAVPMVVA